MYVYILLLGPKNVMKALRYAKCANIFWRELNWTKKVTKLHNTVFADLYLLVVYYFVDFATDISDISNRSNLRESFAQRLLGPTFQSHF